MSSFASFCFLGMIFIGGFSLGWEQKERSLNRKMKRKLEEIKERERKTFEANLNKQYEKINKTFEEMT